MEHLKPNLNPYRKGWLLLCIILLISGCAPDKKTLSPPTPSAVPSPKVSEEPTPKPTHNRQAVATTGIFDKIPERTNNLELAMEAINGKILQPGEEFSFNQTVGDRTEEKGYQKAIGYDENGEKKPTVGGGICQIASTLYMAALNGEFKIVERHSHSHEVPYADSDHDATVSYGGYDFRFQNNRDKPVKITVSTDGESVTAEITETEK